MDGFEVVTGAEQPLAPMRLAQPETGAFMSRSVCVLIITTLCGGRLVRGLARTGLRQLPPAPDRHHAKPEAQSRPDEGRRG
jgi:hypothetical protein